MTKSLGVGLALIGLAVYAALAFHDQRFGHEGETTYYSADQCDNWSEVTPRVTSYPNGGERVSCNRFHVVHDPPYRYVLPSRASWQDWVSGAIILTGVALAAAGVLSSRSRTASA